MNSSWLNLEGKNVIITGGASGIGLATVREFLADGANVVIADMNPNAPELNKEAGNYIYIPCDVTKKADVDNVIAKTVEVYGKIDVLINNAGINIPRLLVDPAQN